MSTIEDNLSTGLFDWAVRDKEARKVLEILKALSDEDLKDTVAEMEKKKLVDRFFRNIPKKDLAANQEALARIKNARVYKEVTKKDGKKVTTTTTGSCSPKQSRRIASMLTQSLSWLANAIGKIDAYLAAPNDASTAKTLTALKDEFKTDSADVATYVRGQLARFQADIRNRNLYAFECHEKWDLSCRASGAYVPGADREKVVFCPSFFTGDISEWDIGGFLHEIAHTQVGGTHISDRAYSSNRMLTHLTTEEALINAESYSRFTQQLVSGSAPGTSAPSDAYQHCKKTGWQPALEKALARAQRWNRDAQVAVAKLTPAKAKKYSQANIALIGGTTEKDIETLQKAVNKLADKLDSRITFECEPKGGGRCDKGDTYWYAIGDLHICPTWILKSPDEQVVALLAGLYGHKAGVDDNTKRLNYARFAQTRTKDPAPSLQRILGDAAWTPDLLSIWLFPRIPVTPDTAYHESGTVHERMSADVPDYQVAPCHSNPLPFEASVVFTVDPNNISRPAPFTPPSVSVQFRYMGQNGPITKAVSDPRADYEGTGLILTTKFEPEFKFTFNRNGPFWMRFEMSDPDSGVNRVYEDTISVETSSLCDIPNQRHMPNQPSDTELA